MYKLFWDFLFEKRKVFAKVLFLIGTLRICDFFMPSPDDRVSIHATEMSESESESSVEYGSPSSGSLTTETSPVVSSKKVETEQKLILARVKVQVQAVKIPIVIRKTVVLTVTRMIRTIETHKECSF